MDNDTLIQFIALFLGSSVVSSIVVAFLGKRKERAEIYKIMTEGRGEGADAAATWIEASIRLQDQREKDLAKFQLRLEELEVKWEEKYEALRLELEQEINRLREENGALKRERQDLQLRIASLSRRLETVEKNGGGLHD